MQYLKRSINSLVSACLFISPVILKAQNAEETKPASPANEAAELAKKLANPIASLISGWSTVYGYRKSNCIIWIEGTTHAYLSKINMNYHHSSSTIYHS